MRSAPKSHPDNSLPEFLDITLEDFNKTYPIWLMWMRTGRRFLPTQLREQPEELMDNILYIDMLYEKIAGQVMEQIVKSEKK